MKTKEQKAEWMRQWRKKHPGYFAKLSRRYRATHPRDREKSIQYQREWRKNHPGRDSQYGKKYRKSHPEVQAIKSGRRRSLKKKCDGKFSFQEWKELCNRYDNKCLRCGEEKKLTIDHVIPLIRGGTNTIDNIQPLCLKCNDIKGTQIVDYRR